MISASVLIDSGQLRDVPLNCVTRPTIAYARPLRRACAAPGARRRQGKYRMYYVPRQNIFLVADFFSYYVKL
jgi:hypothetical protein